MIRVLETITGIILTALVISFFSSPTIALIFGVDIIKLLAVAGVLSLTFIGWMILSFFIRMIYEGWQMRKK